MTFAEFIGVVIFGIVIGLLLILLCEGTNCFTVPFFG